jgi:hypothetical protein
MMSHLTYLVTVEQAADRHRVAEQQRRAAAAAEKDAPRVRESALSSARWTRPLLGLRKRPKLV